MINIPNPLPIQIHPTTKDNQDHAKQEEHRSASLRVAQNLNRITVGIAVLTLFSLFILYLQIQQNKNALMTSQRAWVMPSNINMPLDETTHHNVDFSTTNVTRINFAVRDYGPSPALDVWLDTTAIFTGDKCDRGFTRTSPEKTHTTAPPGVDLIYPNIGVAPLTQECLDSLHNGGAQFKIMGLVHYKDIFQRPHKTRICVTYDGKMSRVLTNCREDDNETD